MATVEERVFQLERWRESVEPMLTRLAQDQVYRERWKAERGKTRARWARWLAWSVGVASSLAVVGAAVAQLVHLL